MMQILFLNKIYKKKKNVAIVNKSETYSVGNVKSLPTAQIRYFYPRRNLGLDDVINERNPIYREHISKYLDDINFFLVAQKFRSNNR